MNKCSLCSGQGCIVKLFGTRGSSSSTLPNKVMFVLYGVPMFALLLGACLGAIFGEIGSIAGALGGLFVAFLCLRACQRALNRLCLQTGQRLGDH